MWNNGRFQEYTLPAPEKPAPRSQSSRWVMGVHTIEPFVRIDVGYGKNGYLA
jgi:hypothetical protein